MKSNLAVLTRQADEIKNNLASTICPGNDLQDELKMSKDGVDHVKSTHTNNEILKCRNIADETLFLLGFARSSTSIYTQVLNSSRDIFILGEANFYLPHHEHRFVDWYKKMHIEFDNQVSKTTYAPDFLPDISHSWLDWLIEAKKCYKLVGDKMAFSAQHFNFVEPNKIQSFFEARFFNSKYIFTLRNPLQTLISTAKLFGISKEIQIAAEIIAWLRFVQMWANWVRIFPNTLTFSADAPSSDTICAIQAFLGIDLSGAERFLNNRHRTDHSNVEEFPLIDHMKGDLAMVFELVTMAMKGNLSHWQRTGRLRSGLLNGCVSPATETPIYEAWAMCEKLIRDLQLLI